MKHEGENYNRIYDVKLVMNYNNGRLGDELMDAIWVCPKCTKRVREETAYNKINQQNNSWLADNDFDNEDYDDLYQSQIIEQKEMKDLCQK